MITDESGEVVKEKKYEAFGNLVWEEGIYEDNREFTGKEKDPTGFHYFGARYYSGDIGRFLTPDPHTVMPGNLNLANPQELNPYVYCYNNPVNLYDPDGNNAALAISTSNLIVDYYYNRHLLQQYYLFYDGCPSCGAGASAKFFPPDNPFGFKFGMACFSHDAAQATVGISWTRASTIFGMALLDMVTEQTNDIFDYDFTPAFELGIVYWIGGSIALPSYFYSQADAQYFIINGRIIRMKNSPKDKRKEEKNKQENQVDKDANSVEDNSINRFNSSNFGTGVNWNPGNYFNPKYHNAGSCEYW